jgi:interferon gamma-inducible protein 30
MFRLVTLAVLFLGVNCDVDYDAKLRVHVFYESLCPDSMNFFQNQLIPNLNNLNDHMEVVLVPFGKSRSSPTGTFSCQHGDTECKLNRIMSCAFTQIPDQHTKVSYAGCQMKWGADRTGRQCVESYGINWSVVSQCHDTDLGKQLQLAAEAEQNRIIGYPKFVPTIVYDERFDQNLQDQSLKNFLGVVCAFIGNGIQACQ